MNVDEIIEKMSNSLKSILIDELNKGNEIREVHIGGFTNVEDDWLFIWLKYQFKTEIRLDIPGIEYRDINDYHYWKAEYNDKANHQTLACNF